MAETSSQSKPELTLYNTLTRSKEPFVPIDAANVRLYVCGPTVYDFAHIGNARPVIVFDVLFRLLRHLYGEDHVTYVRNITDVDDKIIDRARRDFPDLDLNAAIAKVTTETADQFHADVKALGCLEPTHEPRATEFVLPRSDGRTDMVRVIQQLLDKDHAYVAKGREGLEVLFDVSSMPDYGKLSNRKLDEQVAGARVEVEAHKRNPADFVLWKQSTGDEPGWAATFKTSDGETEIFGRPGWHIECSAMSAAYLGEVFDIHGGGIDLAFPHHENEIAQSRCAHGTDVMANVWMHNGFLQVEGQKMSKSLGNFVTIHELLRTDAFGERPWHGQVLRWAMLKTHYRQPIDWTVNQLKEARNDLARWASIAIQNEWAYSSDLNPFRTKISSHNGVQFKLSEKTLSALTDDLNVPQLHAHILELEKGSDHDEEKAVELISILEMMGLMSPRIWGLFERGVGGRDLGAKTQLDLFVPAENLRVARANNDVQLESVVTSQIEDIGVEIYSTGKSAEITFASRKSVEDIEIDAAITARLAARAEKNWAEADRIRDELAAKGILLKDGKDPETGEPVTTWELAR